MLNCAVITLVEQTDLWGTAVPRNIMETIEELQNTLLGNAEVVILLMLILEALPVV